MSKTLLISVTGDPMMNLFRILALHHKVMAVALTLWLVKNFDKDAASLMLFIMELRGLTSTGNASYQMFSSKLQFFPA